MLELRLDKGGHVAIADPTRCVVTRYTEGVGQDAREVVYLLGCDHNNGGFKLGHTFDAAVRKIEQHIGDPYAVLASQLDPFLADLQERGDERAGQLLEQLREVYNA